MRVCLDDAALEKEEKLKEYKKKLKVLKTAYKSLQDKKDELEKENLSLRAKAGVGSSGVKFSMGISDDEVKAIKEKYEKEAYQSNFF
jgi:hypothetical protein